MSLDIYKGYTNAAPEEVGYNPDTIKRLDDHFSALVEKDKLQCASYMMARYDKVFACKSMGKLTYHEGSSDFMPDSIRKIASITKIFASIAIMKLLEEGKLYLDQPMCSIFDEFNNDMFKGITLYHLLTHTSGICPDPGYFTEPYTRGWWDVYDCKIKNNEEVNWIKEILSGPPSCKPGEQWNYSSACFAILGEVVSRTSGIECEKYIIDNICRPLGMNYTFFDMPEELYAKVCYTNEWAEKSLKRKPKDEVRPPRTGGGIYSTLADLNIIGQMLLNNGTYKGVSILSRKTVEAMTRNHLTGVPAFHWGNKYKNMKMGLGISLNTVDLMTPGTFGHEGAGRCALDIDPSESFVAILIIPTNIEWVPESLINAKSMMWSGLL